MAPALFEMAASGPLKRRPDGFVVSWPARHAQLRAAGAGFLGGRVWSACPDGTAPAGRLWPGVAQIGQNGRYGRQQGPAMTNGDQSTSKHAPAAPG